MHENVSRAKSSPAEEPAANTDPLTPYEYEKFKQIYESEGGRVEEKGEEVPSFAIRPFEQLFGDVDEETRKSVERALNSSITFCVNYLESHVLIDTFGDRVGGDRMKGPQGRREWISTQVHRHGERYRKLFLEKSRLRANTFSGIVMTMYVLGPLIESIETPKARQMRTLINAYLNLRDKTPRYQNTYFSEKWKLMRNTQRFCREFLALVTTYKAPSSEKVSHTKSSDEVLQ